MVVGPGGGRKKGGLRGGNCVSPFKVSLYDGRVDPTLSGVGVHGLVSGSAVSPPEPGERTGRFPR